MTGIRYSTGVGRLRGIGKRDTRNEARKGVFSIRHGRRGGRPRAAHRMRGSARKTTGDWGRAARGPGRPSSNEAGRRKRSDAVEQLANPRLSISNRPLHRMGRQSGKGAEIRSSVPLETLSGAEPSAPLSIVATRSFESLLQTSS